jgi:hypothetical protein
LLASAARSPERAGLRAPRQPAQPAMPRGAARQGPAVDELSSAVVDLVAAAAAVRGVQRDGAVAYASSAAQDAAMGRLQEQLQRPGNEGAALSAAALDALERALASPSWMVLWSAASAVYLVADISAPFSSQVAAFGRAGRARAPREARGAAAAWSAACCCSQSPHVALFFHPADPRAAGLRRGPGGHVGPRARLADPRLRHRGALCAGPQGLAGVHRHPAAARRGAGRF